MKKQVYFFILFSIYINAYAQKEESVIARVLYRYTNKHDSIASQKTRSENMILFMGKNASIFASHDKIRHEISEEQKFWNMIANGGGKGKSVFIIDDSKSKWMNNNSYLLFLKENKFYTKEMIAYTAYIMEEPIGKLDWKIQKDTLSFGTLKSQLATTVMDGQNWYAWFTTAVPFSGGPWKLNGLPGLILEAYTDDKSIYYQFNGFENAKLGDHVRDRDVTKGPDSRPGTYNAIDQAIGRDVGNAYFENIIRLPIGAVKVTKKELDKFKDAIKKDPKGMNKAQSGN